MLHKFLSKIKSKARMASKCTQTNKFLIKSWRSRLSLFTLLNLFRKPFSSLFTSTPFSHLRIWSTFVILHYLKYKAMQWSILFKLLCQIHSRMRKYELGSWCKPYQMSSLFSYHSQRIMVSSTIHIQINFTFSMLDLHLFWNTIHSINPTEHVQDHVEHV